MLSIAEVVKYLEEFAPPQLAAEWDNVGLLLGDPRRHASRMMTCLTVTPATAAEAIADKADLVLSHHPMLFKPIQRLTTATAEGRMLLDLIRAGIAVYSPHTAFDNCEQGINQQLGKLLELENLRPLQPRVGVAPFKLVVFVPERDLAKVADALFQAGAGQIGHYHDCSYRLLGTGTFHGDESTNPAIGRKGQREEVAEWRLEVVVPKQKVEKVIAAMRRSHSYEEPAYDLYSLQPAPTAREGEGRVGELAKPATVQEIGVKLRKLLSCGPMQVVGGLHREVRRIAIVCGAGGSFLHQACAAKADLFLTGEARFHDYLTAEQSGIGILLPGHYATERLGMVRLADKLSEQFPDVTTWPSRAECDPVAWID